MSPPPTPTSLPLPTFRGFCPGQFQFLLVTFLENDFESLSCSFPMGWKLDHKSLYTLTKLPDVNQACCRTFLQLFSCMYGCSWCLVNLHHPTWRERMRWQVGKGILGCALVRSSLVQHCCGFDTGFTVQAVLWEACHSDGLDAVECFMGLSVATSQNARYILQFTLKHVQCCKIYFQSGLKPLRKKAEISETK